MKRFQLIFVVISFFVCLSFLIGIRTRNFESSEVQVLSGQSFRDYPLMGNFLLKNNEEQIQFSGNVVSYDGVLSFSLVGFENFSYENTKLNHYLAFFSADEKRVLTLYKNHPFGLQDLCEKGKLFDSEAPDSVLTGLVNIKGQDRMHISMSFDQIKQEQYCFSLGHDYYLLQFTNMGKGEIDSFFEYLEVLG